MGPREARRDDRLRARAGTPTSCLFDTREIMRPHLRGDDSEESRRQDVARGAYRH
jgi:hypothetical protein